MGSQALSSTDSYDRTDVEYLVNGTRSASRIVLPNMSEYATATGGEHHVNIPTNGRISSEEESGFSTPTKSQNGKKLVYEVVV